MSVHKDKKRGTWEVVRGSIHRRGFSTKKDAELFEATLKVNNRNVTEDIYIYNVATDYLNWLNNEYSYPTYIKCYNAINKIILPMIKNKKISQISDYDCRMFHEALMNTNYSTRYKNYLQNKYTVLFRHAEKYFNLKDNPTKHLESFKKTYEDKQKQKQKEMCVWSDDEFVKFIECVDEKQYKALFMTLYLTGMRLGEAQALTWNDYQEGRLVICKALRKCSKEGVYEINDTKTDSSDRVIGIPKVLSDLLDSELQSAKENPDFKLSWFVFGGVNPLPRTTINRIKDKAVSLSGVKRITIHEFRHSHASNLISKGVSIVAVSKRLGHSDVNMTLKIYTHLMPFDETKVLEILDNSYHNLTMV